jgi:hypothetical protein
MMTQPNPEFTPSQIAAAKRKIANLYTGDNLFKVFRSDESRRDALWEQAAREYTPFADKINALRESLKIVDATLEEYPTQATHSRIMFGEVEDDLARYFLADVLISRKTREPKFIDYNIDEWGELNQMAQDLGFEKGWRVEPATKITLDEVVEATLVGRLRFQHPQRLPK